VPKEGYVVVTVKKEAWEALRKVAKEWGVGVSETILRLIQYRDIGERLERLEEKLGRLLQS